MQPGGPMPGTLWPGDISHSCSWVWDGGPELPVGRALERPLKGSAQNWQLTHIHRHTDPLQGLTMLE